MSRLEHRDDMLLSTLYDYLMATGAEGASIVVVVYGHRQARAPNALTRSQFSGSRAVASTLIVERRRVVTSRCRSTSLP